VLTSIRKVHELKPLCQPRAHRTCFLVRARNAIKNEPLSNFGLAFKLRPSARDSLGRKSLDERKRGAASGAASGPTRSGDFHDVIPAPRASTGAGEGLTGAGEGLPDVDAATVPGAIASATDDDVADAAGGGGSDGATAVAVTTGSPGDIDADSNVCRLARMALDVQTLMSDYRAPDGGTLVMRIGLHMVRRCMLTPSSPRVDRAWFER